MVEKYSNERGVIGPSLSKHSGCISSWITLCGAFVFQEEPSGKAGDCAQEKSEP
jgi:hypothetical protein